MIEVELPDGTIVEFPDGTPTEQIQQALQANPQTAPQVASRRGPVARAGSAALRTAGLGSQEFVRGLSNLLGMPVDAINASPQLANLLPGVEGVGPISENPVGGSDFLYENIQRRPVDALIMAVENPVREAAGVEPAATGDIVPENMAERVFARTMNEVGAAAVPIGGLVAAGARTTPQAVRAASATQGPVRRIASDMVESAAVNPARFAGKETLYATGAGTGAGLAREAVSDGDPNTETTRELYADLFGGLAGAGATGVADYFAGGVREGTRALTGSNAQLNEVVGRDVTDTLARGAGLVGDTPDTEPLALALQYGRRIGETVPGFRETAADRTGNPGLANLEYARQTGPNAGQFTARRQENNAATQDAIGGLAPTGTPGTFSGTLRDEVDTYLTGLRDEAETATSEFGDAASRLEPQFSGEERGAVVRQNLDESLARAREEERAAWSGIEGEVDPTGLQAAFDDVTSRMTQAERTVLSGQNDLLSVPGRLIDDEALEAAGATPPVGLREVTTLRGQLSERIRAAQNAGETNTARILNQYVDAIDGFLARQAPEQQEAIEAARGVSRDLNDRFTRPGDPVAQAVQRREGGMPAMEDSRIAPSFVRPDEGQGSRIDRLLSETGDSAEVRRVVEDQILADVRSRGLLDKPDRLTEYLRQYDNVFNKFPDLREQFGSAAALRLQADGAAAKADDELRRLTTQSRSAVANYLSYGDERASQAMANVIASRDPAGAADELLGMVANRPEAIEGARAAFWDLMEGRARASGASTRNADGTQPWKPEALFNFLERPEVAAVAERLYADNPEHLANLKEIAEATRLADTRITARPPGSSGTAVGMNDRSILPSTETLGSRAFAVQRGVVSPGFAGFNIAAIIARRAVRRGNDKAYQDLLDAALLDPSMAAALVRENNPANRAAAARAARVYLGERGAAAAELLTADEGDEEGTGDETVDAIMQGGAQ